MTPSRSAHPVRPLWSSLRWLLSVVGLALSVLAGPASAQFDKPFEAGESAEMKQKRDAMADWLKKNVKGISDRTVKAFADVPRHKYMKAADQKIAYDNKWSGIGWGQTITNPWMVAYMTHLLEVKETDKVLEIGSGSGYQSSILGRLSNHVFSIEVIRPLSERSQKLVKNIGYDKITYRIADGYFGWPEQAPFDKIMVTCAADHIPIPLIQQLKPGGLMLVPVGPTFQRGNIYLVKKEADGTIKRSVVATGTFVPMRRTDRSEE